MTRSDPTAEKIKYSPNKYVPAGRVDLWVHFKILGFILGMALACMAAFQIWYYADGLAYHRLVVSGLLWRSGGRGRGGQKPNIVLVLIARSKFLVFKLVSAAVLIAAFVLFLFTSKGFDFVLQKLRLIRRTLKNV